MWLPAEETSSLDGHVPDTSFGGDCLHVSKVLKQGLIVKYDVKAINRYQKIVIKETKHTIWNKEQLKEVLCAETPENKN